MRPDDEWRFASHFHLDLSSSNRTQSRDIALGLDFVIVTRADYLDPKGSLPASLNLLSSSEVRLGESDVW